jgi:biopolymer transport protein ExbD
MIVNVSNTGYDVNGVSYSTQAELKQALMKLEPKEVRLSIKRDTSYDKVSQALDAVREVGATIGLVGNMQ